MKKHPDLGKKLQTLYSLRVNPEIQSNVDLADQLGVSRQSVSRWCCGTPTQRGDKIPDDKLIPLADAFDIDAFWFTYELNEFADCVKSKINAEKAGPVDKVQHVSIATLPITGLDIFGRDAELTKLNNCWQNARTNVVQIVAFGGVGKSSLVNKWLSTISKDHYRYANRVYAWSFYWQGHSSDIKSSGDFFIEHALEWFGDENPTKGTPWAKASRLAELIRSYRTLLILDGLEPLQRTSSNTLGELENSALALLIKELAADNRGLCILTSRIPVRDLEPFQDGRVETIELENLTVNHGVDLLKSHGVSGGQAVLEEAVRTYSGHPLSLMLLSGYLRVVHQGAVENYQVLKSLMEDKNGHQQAKELMDAYLDWFADRSEKEILLWISIVGRSITFEELRKITQTQKISGLTDYLSSLNSSGWKYALNLLERVNLISTSASEDGLMLDCHPIVRDCVVDQIEYSEPSIWKESHKVIFEHLKNSEIRNPTDREAIERLLRAIIHGNKAGLFDESFDLYYTKIKNGFTMLSVGSHLVDHDCLRTFFQEEWNEPVDMLPEQSRYFLISCASANLVALGRVAEAIAPAIRAIDYFITKELWVEATHAAGPLISAMIEAGRLQEAMSLLDKLMGCVEKTGSGLVRAMALNFRAYAKFLNGDFDEAGEIFNEVESLIGATDPETVVNFPTISSYYCKYLLETNRHKESFERSLQTCGWRKRNSWHVISDTVSVVASDYLVLGLAFMELGDPLHAREYLNKQVDLFRGSDDWLYLSTGLNGRARFFTSIGDFENAKADLEESIDISKRTGARFGEWEAYIEYAGLCQKQGDYVESERYLELAEEMEGMGVYRFREKEITELRSGIANETSLESTS